MANANPLGGFRPILPILSMNQYKKTNASIMYPGDVIQLQSDGIAYPLTQGAASPKVLGVCAGYELAASTTVLVIDGATQQYYVQETGNGTTHLTTTHIGNNCFVVVTAGNATLLKSVHSLKNLGTIGVNAAPVKIHGYHPDDTVNAAYVRARVSFTEHVNRVTTGI